MNLTYEIIPVIYQNKEFTLRKYRKVDAKAIACYANNKKIAAALTDMFPYPYGIKDARAYIKSQLNNYRKKNSRKTFFCYRD